MNAEQLYNTYRRFVYATAITLVKDPHIAEDICQDVFVRVLENKYTGPHFMAWAKRVVYNLVVDLASKNKRLDYMEDMSEIEEYVDDPIEQRELSEYIARLLLRLPAEQREIIVLRYYAGMRYREIQQLNNANMNTLLMRTRLATIKLKRYV